MSVRRDQRLPARPYSRRIQALFFGTVLATAGLLLRLGYMQIPENQAFQAVISVQGYDTIPISGPRGWIYDSEGEVLAADKPVFSIMYVRYQNDLSAAQNVAAQLASISGMSEKSLYNTMINYNKWYPSVTLIQQASPVELAYVAEHRNSLPGIVMITSPLRVYPQGSLAAHEIGYLGAISPSQLTAYEKQGYSPTSQIGLAGLEEQYQSVLRGHAGAEKIPVNPAGVPLPEGVLNYPSSPGDNLVLNMNGYLEKVAEEALVNQIKYLRYTRGEPNVHSGTIVVMNVHTGAVLAMASYPSYNPQWWIGGISPQHYQDFLNNDAGLNRAIAGLYMPGSAEKPLTAMTALMHNEMTPGMLVDDQGGLQIGSYYMRNWDWSGFGVIGLEEALEVSDDTYFYQVGLDMGHYNLNNPPQNVEAWLNGPRVAALKQIQDMGKQFGLTSPTGVDLPGEATGYVTFANPPTLYDLPAAAIGQEEAYSTIGMATYVATIANGGYRYRPEMVHEITSPSGKVVKVYSPHLMDKVDVKSQYISLMRQGMELATHAPEGTATFFFGDDPNNVAAKTGTAESGIPGRNNSVFIGFAPYNNPQIAVAAVIPNVTGEGFHAAAPMAQVVIDAYFKDKGKNFKISQANVQPGPYT
ncbi:MAG: penicillin-binding transpeptidase domain-containing protein [Firmicutes bacterium]|nr:penicillin-binding transpeptidase domain-containing protein [Bacillota bacterium]